MVWPRSPALTREIRPNPDGLLGAEDEARVWQQIVNDARAQMVLDAIPVASRPGQGRGKAVHGSTDDAKVKSGSRRKSELAEDLDVIQRRLYEWLKGLGFKVRGRTFNRTTDDGLTQVISIQMGAFDPPGATYVPGFRSNFYGKFTVNVGVYVPEVDRWHMRGGARSFIREYHCAIRNRLGMLGTEPRDLWWHIRRSEELAADLRDHLERDALAFFQRFQNRDAILRECVRLDWETRGAFDSPPRIVSAIILAERGEAGEARSLLSEQARLHKASPHEAYVRELAERMGLGDLDAP